MPHYRAIILENMELRKEIGELDMKLNEAFQYLLEKLDALAPKVNKRKPIGFKTRSHAT